jgi:GTPase
MTKNQSLPTIPPRTRAFLVGVEIRGDPDLLNMEDSLAELELLANTAGLGRRKPGRRGYL